MAPDAIADEALLTVSRWQRMTMQEHATELLRIWQQRRHLAPALRLCDVPEMDDAEFDGAIEELRALKDSDPQWREVRR